MEMGVFEDIPPWNHKKGRDIFLWQIKLTPAFLGLEEGGAMFGKQIK